MYIKNMPVVRIIDSKYSKLIKDFVFDSDVLNQMVIIPAGFITDFESTGFVKGTCPTAGLIHDYLSRFDSEPVVSKKTAADVYLEVLEYKGTSYMKRYIKYWIIRIVLEYFHKKSISWRL